MEKRPQGVRMLNKSKILVITGAESTGKSALAIDLSKHFDTPYNPEYARDYVLNLKHNYTYEDVEYIAKKQIEQLEKALLLNKPFIILDTWLIVTKVWFQKVYQVVPEWLDSAIKDTHIDLFLVCDTDLPWIADKVRENGGEERNQLHEEYITEIKKYNYNYTIVRGQGMQRTKNALQAVSEM